MELIFYNLFFLFWAHFMPTFADFRQLTHDVFHYAQQKGASDVRLGLSSGLGKSASVRNQEVESLENFEERAASVEIYLGKKRGSASCSVLTLPKLLEATDAAFHIARFSAEDEFAGLPEKEWIAQDCPDLDLYHPEDLTMEDLIYRAKEAESYALNESPLISNSEGASFELSEGFFLSSHTQGFSQGFPYSRFGLSVCVIAGKNDAMQRDFWFHSASSLKNLKPVDEIGKTAARRALRRLNPRKIKTGRYPVLFEPMVALSLLRSFVAAVSGGALYKKASFLCDSLNTAIFPKWLTLSENPFLPQSLGSSPFDSDGVATKKQNTVENGVLKTYFLSAYSARKLGLTPTGHAGGVHNLKINPGESSFKDLLKKMGKGVVVTELLGSGTNLITGDYSRGACGFWVENGEILYPIEEITLAGNLKDIFFNLIAAGNDSLTVGSKSSPSLLIEEMTVGA